ncbi:uncharacterized protein PF3D7_1120000-like [Onthophagus taurus]|uniref:uncharacterized protein PF3D7_1120000-like n=1 Tax=Onthophagus taurus TaxID=166361 RepID=UPI0039BDE08E
MNELEPNLEKQQQSAAAAKRNSGLFSILKWFKGSNSSRESVNSDSSLGGSTSSCDSVDSTNSTGTVASFSFVPPHAYKTQIVERCVQQEPETDTYKARVKQREKVKERDKNLTLRKKYNLFFNRDTLLKPSKNDEDNSKSLPLMTKKEMSEEERIHRRTASESSKIKKAGAYCHVKGKRKAPAPPSLLQTQDNSEEGTTSWRRKKRVAPAPPKESKKTKEKQDGKYETIQYVDSDVLFNDSLKLEHGILKPAKDQTTTSNEKLSTSPNSSHVEAPVSPRPWYKRNSAVPRRENVPETSRNSTSLDLNIDESRIDRKKDDKRKSGLSFLTNISELDREATEIMKKEKEESSVSEMPAFMRPKQETSTNSVDNNNTLVSPKRKSAKDLIAKFNAITNVTKVTVNPFQKNKDYFGKSSKDQKKNVRKGGNDTVLNPLMKSESASAIKSNTPKADRKSWNCPKCSIQNEYWRIICHVCSTIKPYFDDLALPSSSKNSPEKNVEIKPDGINKNFLQRPSEIITGQLERSKTQIGFTALSRYNEQKDRRIEKSVSVDETKNKNKEIKSKEIKNKEIKNNEIKIDDAKEGENKLGDNKREEREKLIKMLIEMKNSLPKRKLNSNKDNKRTSIIEEGLEMLDNEAKMKEKGVQKDMQKDIEKDLGKDVEKEFQKVIKKDVQKDIQKNVQIGMQQGIIKEMIKEENIEKEINENNQLEQTEEEKKVKEILFSKDVGFKIKQPDKTNKPTFSNFLLNGQIKNANPTKNAKETPQFVNGKSLKEQFFKENISNEQPVKEQHQMNEILEPNKAELILVTQETIYENIKMKKTEAPKPLKVSSSAQTSAVVRKVLPESVSGAIKKDGRFELMKAKDFAEKTVNLPDHVYANLAAKDNMSLFVNMPKKFAELKDNLLKTEISNTDTLEINRLLRRLETAIAKGEMTDAAIYARDLAQLKVNCSVIRQKENKAEVGKRLGEFLVNMFVEDRLSHRGPFPIKVIAEQTVGELKIQVEKEFEIPTAVQRWILGKELATQDGSTLKDHHVTTEGCPIFLYLVAPTRDSKVIEEKKLPEEKPINKKEDPPNKQTTDLVKPQIVDYKVKQPPKNLENIKIDITIEEKQISKPLNTVPTQNEASPSASSSSILTENTKHLKTFSDDDDDDYDCKTLKPLIKDWECRMCTLLNPITSNICAVCAFVRPTIAPRGAKKKAPQPMERKKHKEEIPVQHYQQLVNLDSTDLVENTEKFECVICMIEIEKGEGVTLRECLHQFCKLCLAHTIKFTEEAEVKCPYRDDQYSCDIALQDREIKALVSPDIYEQFLARSVTQAENRTEKSFHCKSPDCKGWCIFEDNVNEFRCPVCKKVNCLTCQAIHTGLNCKQYQERMNDASAIDEDAKRTREMLEEMVNKGEALNCPACQVILMKKWGCDWVRCSMCKTEICWVTKGPRWGPAGKGDTSGGCKCGVNGVKCHAQCNYCH